MEAKTIKQLLKRFLAGETGNIQTDQVNNWYHSFEQNEVQFAAGEREATGQEIWEKIAPTLVVEKKRTARLYWWVGAAAAVLAGAVASLVWLRNTSSSTITPAYTVISTRNGERKTVTIKDGSQLVLNAGSTVHIYNDFSTQRNVDLIDGEVFFHVQRDTLHPFVIHNNALTVTVLGTSFNVSAYKDLGKVRVGVVSGKVAVARENAPLGILTKSTQLVYDNKLQTTQTGVLEEDMLAWQEDRLVLNDASFTDMALYIRKNFGIDVLTDDTDIKQSRYTTTLYTNMTGSQAVEVLAAIHHYKIKKVNEQVYFIK